MYSITDFYERMIALLASQFQESLENGDRTNFQKFLAAMISECYEINNVELQLLNDRWLPYAQGIQLDLLGAILGLKRRENQSDESYRDLLYIQIFINRSNATPEECIYILKYLTNATKINYFEPYPAFFQMQTNGLPAEFLIPVDEIVPAIHSISPAGVQYCPITWYYMLDKGFGFTEDPIVENFYVSADPLDLSSLNPFEVSLDGITSNPFQINRGLVNQNPNFGGFAEDGYDAPNRGRLAEVLILNGNIPPPY